MKRLQAIVMVIVMVVLLGGCGRKDTTETDLAEAQSVLDNASAQVQDIEDQPDISESLETSEWTDSSETSELSDSSETPESTGSSTPQLSEPDPPAESVDLIQSDAYDVIQVPDFEVLSQYPELPTGCEMTSLTMVLNYLGYPVDKCELSDYYLNKGPVGEVDFHEAFEGDPRDENSYGCYAPVVVDTANKYLMEQGSSLRAVDYTGSSLDSLKEFIARGVPVIVWGTQDCREGHYSVTWTVNGKDLTWYTPEHCMVFIGYDNETIYVADPMHGYVFGYAAATFELRYQELFRQAVVIE